VSSGNNDSSESPECAVGAELKGVIFCFCLESEVMSGADLYDHLVQFFIKHVNALRNVRSSCFFIRLGPDHTQFHLVI
jgi:hypothetical protein